MEKVFRMLGGEDEGSYSKNSSVQRLVLWKVKPILEKCIENFLRDLGDLPRCLKVADLGCSSGPNTFLTALHIIESIDKACSSQMVRNEERPPAVIQYFLNDLVSNDFNLVFKGLPEFYRKLEKENGRRYGSFLMAAMPGSFYGRLSPDRSMHFMHSSYSLHWLSQVPQRLTAESGIPRVPINKGNIYCAKTSPPIVRQLYLDQFTQDFSIFLRMRSQEMEEHGQLLLTLMYENDEDTDCPKPLDLLGMALYDLVLEGCIEEGKVDSFNSPFFQPSIDGIKQVIEKEGSFRILKFHTFKIREDDILTVDPNRTARDMATSFRAMFQPLLVAHFGEAIMDDLFRRFADKLVYFIQMRQGCLNSLLISLQAQ